MNKGNYTDAPLISSIKAGGSACDQAIAWIYRKHLDAVLSFIMARNGSREEAKDIFQDAVLSLLMSIQEGKFEGKSSLSTYLHAISKNLWYRRFRRSITADEYKASLNKDEIELGDPEYLMVDQDTEAQLQGLMDSLKDKCKEVLTMWAQKYSMKEIAAALGYSNEQVVRNKKNHCLKELKELVRKNPEVRNLIGELLT